MNNEYICPKCGEDLVKVGFISKEMILTHFNWTFKKSKGFFDSDKGSQEGTDDNPEFECSHCEQDITQYIRDKNLV